MKVYIVTVEQNYEGKEILEVFTTEEAAEAYIELEEVGRKHMAYFSITEKEIKLNSGKDW